MRYARRLFAIGSLAGAGAASVPGALKAQFERLDPRFDALVPSDAVVEVLADGIEWAEGPVWDPNDEALLLSDVPRNIVFRWKEGEGLSEYLEPSGYTGEVPFTGREPGSNGLIFDGQGRLLLCQHGDRRVVRREADGSFTVIADRYEDKRFNSPNDLTFGPNGDLYFTDPPYGLPGTFESSEKELDFQGVYRVSADGTVSLVTAELSAPNGIGFSPDGSTLYIADSRDALWMAYPVLADGSIGEGRRFAEATGDDPGAPDGLEVDVNGNLFATGPGGVHVFAPDGTRLGRIVTGVPTGNVAWGDDGSVLYIAANDRLLRVRTTTRGFPGFQR
ncbi:MAG: SMP-30/gluconolactonase/LRE family protein [Longimicrobiales bacterium]